MIKIYNQTEYSNGGWRRQVKTGGAQTVTTKN